MDFLDSLETKATETVWRGDSTRRGEALSRLMEALGVKLSPDADRWLWSEFAAAYGPTRHLPPAPDAATLAVHPAMVARLERALGDLAAWAASAKGKESPRFVREVAEIHIVGVIAGTFPTAAVSEQLTRYMDDSGVLRELREARHVRVWRWQQPPTIKDTLNRLDGEQPANYISALLDAREHQRQDSEPDEPAELVDLG